MYKKPSVRSCVRRRMSTSRSHARRDIREQRVGHLEEGGMIECGSTELTAQHLLASFHQSSVVGQAPPAMYPPSLVEYRCSYIVPGYRTSGLPVLPTYRSTGKCVLVCSDL